MKNQKKISVFTATYNRAYILEQLYDSLCRQTCKDFEWLIVDDGSTDNTADVVEKWQKEGAIVIKYYKQENGGKQRAHNYAVEVCQTELFLIVDSDDYLVDDGIEELLNKWETVKNKDKVAGIIALHGDIQGKLLGTQFPEGIEYTTIEKLYSKYKFVGDAALMYRTDVLKKFPFWVADGEKFIGEGYVWQQIDQKYEMALLFRVLTKGEYLADGYTKNVRKVTKQNPKSYMCLKKQTIILANSWWERYIQTILYLVGCILSKEKHPLSSAPYKILAILAYIPSWIAFFLFYRNA